MNNIKDFGNQELNLRSLHDVNEIVYIIKEAEKKKRPKPIVLIGAGTSVTSGIPLADTIKNYVLKNYENKPLIKSLDKDATYFEIMRCISPMERNELFKSYLEKSKINISSLLLVNLLKEKKIDYILSVNFDDLLIKASALLGFIPSFYDIANIRDFTTTNFPIGSIIYLHGFQFSSWLLNTNKEFQRVEKLIPELFTRICNDRTWIILGYSGNDPVFKYLSELGRFDNNLYWVCYENNSPSREVNEMILGSEEKNAYLVYGYNSDAFLSALQYGLDIRPPKILLNPFSYLKEMYENLSEIDFNNSKRIESMNQFASINYLLENSKERINDAIMRYEEMKSTGLLNSEDLRFNSLIYVISECILTQKFESIEDEVKQMLLSKNEKFIEISSSYYESWGSFLLVESRLKSDLGTLDKAIDKYEKACNINPKNFMALDNWAIVLQDKARMMPDTKFYQESFSKLESSVKINPDSPNVYIIWGKGFEELARLRSERNDYSKAADKYSTALKFQPKSVEALIRYAECNTKLAIFDQDLDFLKDSEKKFQRAFEQEKNNDSILYNWGNCLYLFGKTWKTNNEYLEKSLRKFEEATTINSRNFGAYNNWGNALLELAVRTKIRKTFYDCFEKYEKCVEIKKQDSIPYTNWGNALIELAKITNDKSIINEALSKYESAYGMNKKDIVNLMNWGRGLCELGVRTLQVKYFNISIEKFEEAIQIDPKNFNLLINWGKTLYELFKITKDESAIKLAYEKFEKATEIKSDDPISYSNMAEAKAELAKLKKDKKLFDDAIKVLESAEEKNLKSFGMYNTWGLILYESGIYQTKNDYLIKSVDWFKKSLELNPENDIPYFNIGHAQLIIYENTKSETDLKEAILSFEQSLTSNTENLTYEKKLMIVKSKLYLADHNKDCELYKWGFKNLNKLTEEKPDDEKLLNILSTFLIRYSRILQDIDLKISTLKEAKDISKKAMELGDSPYNLACSQALLGNEIEAFEYLKKSLKENKIAVDHILKDEDWNEYKDKEDFLKIIEEYT
jgi:tetratricopeptide (TPR) repeat protein